MGCGSTGLAVFNELLIYPEFESCYRESFHLLKFEIAGFIPTSISSIENTTSLLTHRHRLGCAQKLK